jgi:IPT/TIG domain
MRERNTAGRIVTMGLWSVLFPILSASAANRFLVEQKDLVIGQTGQKLTVLCDNDFPAYGFSMAVKFETTKINITALALAGAWAAPATNNDVWMDLKYDNATGDILCGAVYDFSPKLDGTDNTIPVGTNHQVLTATVDVKASASTTTLVDFRDRVGVSGKPDIRNILTNSNAASIVPTLVDTTLTIKSLKPVIQRPLPAGNSGAAGKEFTVKATNLDVAGITIQVQVCGKSLVRDAADGFKLLADKITLSIVAPTCGTTGFAPVVVTTDYGSDTEPNGFNYLEDLTPVITTIAPSAGPAGTDFVISGKNLNRTGRSVKVCGKVAISTAAPDGVSLRVTAPACASGPADVQVCTNDGCTTKTGGFTYTAAGTPFVRGDSNGDDHVDLADAVSIFNDLFLGIPARASCRDALDTDDTGDLDLTDGVAVLLYLFQSGNPPKPPFPDAGLDPTPTDGLPSC